MDANKKMKFMKCKLSKKTQAKVVETCVKIIVKIGDKKEFKAG